MKYNCPVCNQELKEWIGNGMYPGSVKHGITLSCPHLNCSAQEIMGHGSNVKEAYEIVKSRFSVRTMGK